MFSAFLAEACAIDHGEDTVLAHYWNAVIIHLISQTNFIILNFISGLDRAIFRVSTEEVFTGSHVCSELRTDSGFSEMTSGYLILLLDTIFVNDLIFHLLKNCWQRLLLLVLDRLILDFRFNGRLSVRPIYTKSRLVLLIDRLLLNRMMTALLLISFFAGASLSTSVINLLRVDFIQ